MAEGTAILILTFDNMESGDKALKTLKAWQKDKMIDVADAVVLVKDDEGNVKVHETEEFTTRRGAVAGGVAGLVIGTIIGGPVGGLVLGGVAGAIAGKKIDLGVSNDEIQAVSDSMENASSSICIQIKSIKNKDMLAAAVRQSGGKVHELSVTDSLDVHLDDMMGGTVARGF